MLCFGKSASLSPLEKIRAMVLPSVLVKFIDRLLATSLGNHLARLLPLLPGCIFGALKRTQANDVARGAALAMEKGLDGHSDASVYKGDVRR